MTPEDGNYVPKHVGVENLERFNPLPLLFKALLHGQKDCVFSAGI
jgi:hypothetical protein